MLFSSVLLNTDPIECKEPSLANPDVPITEGGEGDMDVSTVYNTHWDVQVDSRLTMEYTVNGLIFHPLTKQLVVRAGDSEGPVQVRDSRDGHLVQRLGKGVGNITDPQTNRQIALDTTRDLYLLPCADGSLVRMEMDGRVRDVAILGFDLRGVTYVDPDDVYVVSDVSGYASRVLVVCPHTLTVTKRLGDRKTFISARNVCVGDIGGATTIVVSDWGRCALLLYTTDGELIRTYGPATPLGDMTKPQGVSVDRSGRIVICDKNNYRVLRVWSDKDGDHWECLLGRGQLDGQPFGVAIDDVNRRMAVEVFYKYNDKSNIIMYSF